MKRHPRPTIGLVQCIDRVIKRDEKYEAFSSARVLTARLGNRVGARQAGAIVFRLTCVRA
jgi:hypothetical protein